MGGQGRGRQLLGHAIADRLILNPFDGRVNSRLRLFNRSGLTTGTLGNGTLVCAILMTYQGSERKHGTCIQEQQQGPVAQLGARFHGMEEVDGSNPSRSTRTPVTTVYSRRLGVSALEKGTPHARCAWLSSCQQLLRAKSHGWIDAGCAQGRNETRDCYCHGKDGRNSQEGRRIDSRDPEQQAFYCLGKS